MGGGVRGLHRKPFAWTALAEARAGGAAHLQAPLHQVLHQLDFVGADALSWATHTTLLSGQSSQHGLQAQPRSHVSATTPERRQRRGACERRVERPRACTSSALGPEGSAASGLGLLRPSPCSCSPAAVTLGRESPIWQSKQATRTAVASLSRLHCLLRPLRACHLYSPHSSDTTTNARAAEETTSARCRTAAVQRTPAHPRALWLVLYDQPKARHYNNERPLDRLSVNHSSALS